MTNGRSKARTRMLGAGLHRQQKTSQQQLQTPSMQLAMRIMASRLTDIRQFAREMADDNPMLDLTLPELPISNAGAPDLDGFSEDAVRGVSLIQHVTEQIGQMFSRADDRYLAMAMLAYLSPAGWLDEGAEAAMADAGFDGDDFHRVLTELQNMEPAGLWARNLRECLMLQCRDRGVWFGDIALVLDHMDAFLSGTIADATGLDAVSLHDAVREIRRCTPKPGAMFLYDEGDIFTPDMIVTRTSAGLDVSVNHTGMPSLTVKDSEAGTQDEASRVLLDDARKQVSALERGIRNRAEMMLRAGQILVQRQRMFLTKGERHIAPFSMTELAAMMGCHKSTISRLVADKLVQTPLGMMAMERLFASSLRQPKGHVVAGRAVQAIVHDLVREGGSWTDQKIAAALKDDGISVARRTVNKYRQSVKSD